MHKQSGFTTLYPTITYFIANNLTMNITLQLNVFKLTKILKITNSG